MQKKNVLFQKSSEWQVLTAGQSKRSGSVENVFAYESLRVSEIWHRKANNSLQSEFNTHTHTHTCTRCQTTSPEEVYSTHDFLLTQNIS